jgi:uncharacterized membrane protein
MLYSATLFLHICGALVGLIAGWIAMAFRKGAREHGVAGDIFVLAMIAMTLPAIGLALFKNQSINAIVGVLTFYLAVSAWLTVWRRPGERGLPEVGLMTLAFADAGVAAVFGRQALNAPGGALDGIPAFGFFIFGSIAALGALLDSWMLLHGDVQGAKRIARHLWRMCFALLITTLSTFVGKRIKFPEPLRNSHILDLPLIVLAVLTVYWLVRVRIAPGLRKIWAARSVASAAKPSIGATS